MAEEATLQKKIISWLKSQGCMVIKQNATAYSAKGVPDILFFKEQFYGAIEVKAHKNSPHRPGQDEFIRKFDNWSYGRFIYQENWEREKGYLEELLK